MLAPEDYAGRRVRGGFSRTRSRLQAHFSSSPLKYALIPPNSTPDLCRRSAVPRRVGRDSASALPVFCRCSAAGSDGRGFCCGSASVLPPFCRCSAAFSSFSRRSSAAADAAAVQRDAAPLPPSKAVERPTAQPCSAPSPPSALSRAPPLLRAPCASPPAPTRPAMATV